MENAELGRLVQDHRDMHQLAARRRAELEQVGEYLILLGNNLKNHPQSVRPGEAKITVTDANGDDRTILLSELDAGRIRDTVDELIQSAEQERGFAHRLRETNMGYIVDGLENRNAPTNGILQHPGAGTD